MRRLLCIAWLALPLSCSGGTVTTAENLAPLADGGTPDASAGAAACGDGACSATDSEDCVSCPDDCGECGTCGDGVCSLANAETCEVCAQDCGECGSCGDARCEPGVESCDDCPQDCGVCSVCGDGQCDDDAAGEDCATCPQDCDCPGCGDGVCDGAASESCGSCAGDCGSCQTCGDGECDAAAGEDCGSCAEDCGNCQTCGDGECDVPGEDCSSCAKDCGTCERPGCVQGDFKVYWGNLHAHTHYSDGEGTPGIAFAHAKNAGLDFMWITDHRNRLTSTEWTACRDQADTANVSGTFVAGCGYEFGIDTSTGSALGHLNVLFRGTLMARPTGLASMYQAVADCSPCVGQWNHPPWPGNFTDYKYYAVGENGMRLMELSGHGEWPDKWASYFTALRNGWHFSPSANEDNHSQNWGDSHRATGIWVTELSRTAIRKAVRGRRTFAAFDDTAWIKMTADDVCFMGSVLKGLGPTEIKVVAKDKQAQDTFKRIDLYSPAGTVIATHACNGSNPCTAVFARNPSQATFFVARATQTDGGQIVSGPIWFEP